MAYFDQVLPQDEYERKRKELANVPAQHDYKMLPDTRGFLSRAHEFFIGGMSKIGWNPAFVVPAVPLYTLLPTQIRGISMQSAGDYFPNLDVTQDAGIAPSVVPNYNRKYTVIPIPRMNLENQTES
jgi:hypothetical protein